MAKNTGKALLFLGLVGTAIYGGVKLMSVQTAVENFSYEFKKIRIKKRSNLLQTLLNPIEFVLELYIINKSNTPITFRNLNVDVSVNGNPLTNVTYNQRTVIEGDAKTLIKPEFTISWTALSSQALSLLKQFLNSDNTSITAHVKGFIEAGNINLPIDDDIPLTT